MNKIVICLIGFTFGTWVSLAFILIPHMRNDIKQLTIQESIYQASIQKLSDDLKKLSPIIKRLDSEDIYIQDVLKAKDKK